MATTTELSKRGVLVPLHPHLAAGPGDQVFRTIFATSDLWDWLNKGLPMIPFRGRPGDLSPKAQLRQRLRDYVIGSDMDDDRRFKKLNRHPQLHVWEFKTTDIRLFGFFHRRSEFIGCFGDDVEEVKKGDKYGLYMAQTDAVARALGLDDPVKFEGDIDGVL